MSDEQEIQELKEELLTPKKRKVIPKKDMLSSGSTMLNLAISGRPSVCWVKGKYYAFVGDSQSGKTWLALTTFAEAAADPEFDEYALIYDNVEDGALMDLEEYFGMKAAARIRPPRGTREEPVFSNRIEDFYDNLYRLFDKGRKFIYILDSMDCLSSEDEEKKLSKQRSARANQAKEAGSFGDGKAKKNSQNMRNIVRKLSESGSILIVIIQTRDNIGFGAQFDPKTYAGGKSLLFYAACQIWTKVKERLKKTVLGKARKVGVVMDVRTRKNRVTGHDCNIETIHYRSSGIDDTGSLIRFMIEEGRWKGSGVSVEAKEFEFKGPIERLVRMIEQEDREGELRALVHSVWKEIEEASQVKRKKRYE